MYHNINDESDSNTELQIVSSYSFNKLTKLNSLYTCIHVSLQNNELQD